MAFDRVQVNTSLVDSKLIKTTSDHSSTSKSCWGRFSDGLHSRFAFSQMMHFQYPGIKPQLAVKSQIKPSNSSPLPKGINSPFYVL